MLSVRKLSKSFGSRVVLNDLTFSVPRGSVAILVGENGSGKSTLLRCLAGLAPFAGEADVAGRPLDAGPEVRRLFGYLPQSVGLPPTVLVGEALAFFSALRGVEPGDHDLPTGFLPEPDRPVGIISGGQQQRLAIAIASLGRPPLLLLDEPVSNLDDEGRAMFLAALEDVRRDGRSALVASPSPGALLGVADHLIRLGDGDVAEAGPIDRPDRLELLGPEPEAVA